MLVSALGDGIVYLPHDLVLTWNLDNEKEAMFVLTVPDSEKADFKWVGIGFKDTQFGDSMRQSDITVIHFKNESFEDRWAEQNGMPAIDQAEGGVDNIDNEKYKKEEGYSRYTWKKDYSTHDSYDVELIQGKEYNVLWALGYYEEDGVTLKRHKINNRGSTLITFTSDFDSSVETEEETEETAFLSLK